MHSSHPSFVKGFCAKGLPSVFSMELFALMLKKRATESKALMITYLYFIF